MTARHRFIWVLLLVACGIHDTQAQLDAGVNLAGALISRAVILVEFPLDSAATWSFEAGVYYSSTPELREAGAGRVLARERNYGVVLDARRYFRADHRTGVFAGPWLRANQSIYTDRSGAFFVEQRRQETSVGLLVGYKHLTASRVFIEPVLGIGATVLNLIPPLNFRGDDVFSLTQDYIVRLRAGYRF